MTKTVSPLFEDNHLLVLDKPAGMITQPDATGQISLEQEAKEWIKVVYAKPGNVFLHAAHRIDKPVSGVVLFAKTSKALARVNASIRSKQVKKTYRALVEGTLTEDTGELIHFIFHDDFRATIVSKTYPEAKEAILRYTVLSRKKNSTLVEIDLITGRYHQIRLQFATIGHPIIGDYKYGGTTFYKPDAIALNHQCLEIAHPISQECLAFRSLQGLEQLP